ncbi:D-alanyl-D-alanine carboxypeptidase [Anthocerotibacter panamensis]|uniref:D-alanyl-D-alanine carboxypeptidase n=1 Tax=Anthocerotibacter panamensis TaxID=2857077 RepID=UPI001C40334C|nr:D-alanyl-D-alanine carboxypeptidase [Anthocerotibacter panamensis]
MNKRMWPVLLVLGSLLGAPSGQAGPLWDALQTKLKANRVNPRLQGVLVLNQEGRVLENFQGGAPLPAASVTKLATTLAAMDRWGVNHQFETKIWATGPISNGVLQGDLYLQGGEDPLFLWEDGFTLGHRLEDMGIRSVTGALVVSGPFWMNFSVNPQASANTLRVALNRGLWSPTVSKRYRSLAAGNHPCCLVRPAPAVRIQGIARTVNALPVPPETEPLTVYPSLPLWKIAKRMNAYSSNPLANMLGLTAGGPWAIRQQLSQTWSIPPQAISVETSSGLGRGNKFTPEAVATILNALQGHMDHAGLQLADVLAVKGPEPGTLHRRGMPAGIVAKTGTLNGVSCLAGVVETSSQGPLRFVLLNQGPVATLRKLQDWFLNMLQARYGRPEGGVLLFSRGFVDERLLVGGGGAEQMTLAPDPQELLSPVTVHVLPVSPAVSGP